MSKIVYGGEEVELTDEDFLGELDDHDCWDRAENTDTTTVVPYDVVTVDPIGPVLREADFSWEEEIDPNVDHDCWDNAQNTDIISIVRCALCGAEFSRFGRD